MRVTNVARDLVAEAYLDGQASQAGPLDAPLPRDTRLLLSLASLLAALKFLSQFTTVLVLTVYAYN